MEPQLIINAIECLSDTIDVLNRAKKVKEIDELTEKILELVKQLK